MLIYNCRLSIYFLGINMNVVLHKIPIQENESLFVQPGSMLAFGGVTMKTEKISETFFRSIINFWFSAERLFHNRFTADKGTEGWVALDGHLGIAMYELAPNETLTALQGALVARDEGVMLSVAVQGAQGIWAGTGLVVQQLTNTTDKVKRVFLETQGCLQELKINGTSSVDNKNIVAYTNGLSIRTIRITKLFSIAGLFGTSREPCVNEFTGTGSVFVRIGHSTPQQSSLVRTALTGMVYSGIGLNALRLGARMMR
jgi:uncharacterized protein (AIM24 family)